MTIYRSTVISLALLLVACDDDLAECEVDVAVIEASGDPCDVQGIPDHCDELIVHDALALITAWNVIALRDGDAFEPFDGVVITPDEGTALRVTLGPPDDGILRCCANLCCSNAIHVDTIDAHECRSPQD